MEPATSTSMVFDSIPIPEKVILVPFFACIENCPSTFVNVLFFDSVDVTVIPSKALPLGSLTCPL